MKYFILVLFFISNFACAVNDYNYYLKIGTGYKFDEQKFVRLEHDNSKIFEIENSPVSARFEAGIETGNLTFGVSHHSQWATGFPFNKTGEYYKTELFIDYKFTFGGN